jgi:NTP pyrophosphatase (non-canonical NTP hydrolase)
MTPELREHLQLHLDWSPVERRLEFLAIALGGESGEILNEIKKQLRDNIDRREQIVAEVVDCANYVAMLGIYLGLDLPTLMLNKLREVEARPAWLNRRK